jgi:hypothetical protein
MVADSSVVVLWWNLGTRRQTTGQEREQMKNEADQLKAAPAYPTILEAEARGSKVKAC